MTDRHAPPSRPLPLVVQRPMPVSRLQRWWIEGPTWAINLGTILVIALVAWIIHQSPSLVTQLIAVTAGLLLLAAMATWPDRTVELLLAVLPFQIVLLAQAWTWGAPDGLVRSAGAWAELGLAALVGVALAAAAREPRRLDVLDWLALTYLLMATAYLVVPLALASFVDMFPSAPDDPWLLSRSYRVNATFVLLFLAVRHIGFTDHQRRRFGTAALVAGGVVAALAVVEYLAVDSFLDFFTNTVRVKDYANVILNTDLVGNAQPSGVERDTIRVGSVLFSALTMGFFLLTTFALAMQRFLRLLSRASLATVALAGAAILLTFTRSAVLGLGTVLIATAWSFPRLEQNKKARALMAGVGAAVAGLWVAASVGVIERFQAAADGTDSSAEGHWERTAEGVRLIIENPLGLGLATGPTTGSSTHVPVLTENSYLQVGAEMGILTMLVFVLLLVGVVVVAFRAARSAETTGLTPVVATAGVGLLVGGLFLHVWIDQPTAWTFWALAGLAVPHAGRAELPHAGRAELP